MFQKILVPYDGSAVAAKIFPQVIDVARTHGSKVTLIFVTRSMEILDAPALGVSEFTDEEAKAAEGFLSSAAVDFKARGVDTDWVKIEGTPGQEVVAYASRNGYDLVAMATHCRGELAWVLGSVAEKVATHATVPVLLLRAGAPCQAE